MRISHRRRLRRLAEQRAFRLPRCGSNLSDLERTATKRRVTDCATCGRGLRLRRRGSPGMGLPPRKPVAPAYRRRLAAAST